jgi:organic radical activating enzyme
LLFEKERIKIFLMKISINDSFFSIEGESPFHFGERAFFLRLSGCNLQCKNCDTDYSEKGKVEIATLIKKFLNSPVRLLKITGGEPLLQKEAVMRILESLSKTERTIEVETNGLIQTRFPPYCRVIVSFKGQTLLGSEPKETWKAAMKTLKMNWQRIPTAAKLTTDNEKEVKEFFQFLRENEFDGIISISPLNNDLARLKKIIEDALFYPIENIVKFLPQIQKNIDLP